MEKNLFCKLYNMNCQDLVLHSLPKEQLFIWSVPLKIFILMDYITRVIVLVECILFTQADNPMAKFFEMTVVHFIFSSLVSWVENPYQEFFLLFS